MMDSIRLMLYDVQEKDVSTAVLLKPLRPCKVGDLGYAAQREICPGFAMLGRWSSKLQDMVPLMLVFNKQLLNTINLEEESFYPFSVYSTKLKKETTSLLEVLNFVELEKELSTE